jgi:hypothetical protein
MSLGRGASRFFGEGQPIDPDETTEGLRLAAMRTALATVADHPSLGVGAAGINRLIAPPAVPNLPCDPNDSSCLPLIAPQWLAYTLYRWRAFKPQHRDILIVLLLWLCVAWQFIGTFPRLDLWIAFWVALAWMRGGTNGNRVVPREIGSEASLKGFAPLDVATRRPARCRVWRFGPISATCARRRELREDYSCEKRLLQAA